MALRKKKKVVEPVVEEQNEVTEEVVQAVATAIVEEAEEQDKTVEEVVGEIVDEVVIEPVDEIPEDAEVVEEVVIEAVADDTIKVGDRIQLIKMVDYAGRVIPRDPSTVFIAYSVHGDKVVLKDRGLLSGTAKIDNVKKI